MNVLLVEDDPSDVLFFRRALVRAGAPWGIDVACDGHEALARLAGPVPPTHVVLDLKLPKHSGLEILAWIRGRPSTAALPVIVLTSSSEPTDVLRARSLGVDDYLSSRTAVGSRWRSSTPPARTSRRLPTASPGRPETARPTRSSSAAATGVKARCAGRSSPGLPSAGARPRCGRGSRGRAGSWR